MDSRFPRRARPVRWWKWRPESTKQRIFTEVTMRFTAVFRKVPEGYIGFVEELPGANTQGASLEEVRINLAEAVEFVLDANRTLSEESIKGEDVDSEPLVISLG